jgi:large subunit ribosomal protein L17
MRHNKKFNHLGRKTAHRKAMLANMASLLFNIRELQLRWQKQSFTGLCRTIAYQAKDDTTHSRRTVFSHLQNKEVVTELFQNVSVKIANRPGGYTRILRTGFRLGDNAEMCIIELVDYNENMLKEKAAKKAARTRRAGAKKAETAAPAVAPAAVVEEPVATEETPAAE